MFGPQVESGSEPEDDSQMKFYTEQHRGRRRNKGERKQRLLTPHPLRTCCKCGVGGKKEPAEAAERWGEMRPDILGSVNVAGSRRESSTFTVRFKVPLADTGI